MKLSTSRKQNLQRAMRAEEVLVFYSRLYNMEPQMAPRDLITDLLHYLRMDRVDGEHEHEMALQNYRDEISEEEVEEKRDPHW